MDLTCIRLLVNAFVLKVAFSALIPQDQCRNQAPHDFRSEYIDLRKSILPFLLVHFSAWQLIFQQDPYRLIRDYKLRPDI